MFSVFAPALAVSFRREYLLDCPSPRDDLDVAGFDSAGFPSVVIKLLFVYDN